FVVAALGARELFDFRGVELVGRAERADHTRHLQAEVSIESDSGPQTGHQPCDTPSQEYLALCLGLHIWLLSAVYSRFQRGTLQGFRAPRGEIFYCGRPQGHQRLCIISLTRAPDPSRALTASQFTFWKNASM